MSMDVQINKLAYFGKTTKRKKLQKLTGPPAIKNGIGKTNHVLFEHFYFKLCLELFVTESTRMVGKSNTCIDHMLRLVL